MNYVIRFTGKVSWEGQMNGLPSEIYAFLLFLEYDKKMFDAAIEGQAAQFVAHQAMVVQRDQGAMIDIRQTPADRMLVPMKWIVNITSEVHNLVGELSIPDESGVERFSNGEEPVKQ